MKKIAIACQGGGSHTAFTAGVLRKLTSIPMDYHISTISGTSGGAICSFILWYSIVLNLDFKELINKFWDSISAKTFLEKSLNDFMLSELRNQEEGFIPMYSISPYSFVYKTCAAVSKHFYRPEFLSIKNALNKLFDITKIDQEKSSTRLLIGAVDVLTGEFKVFDSLKGEINIDSIIASTAVPSIFKAVKVKESIYWDGLLSQNPPIRDLISDKPDEIWVIKINPQSSKFEPKSVREIEDRRNELSGNLSLNQEINFIESVNKWIKNGTISLENKKIIKVRIITMSGEVEEILDYVSKLDRNQEFINALMYHGEEQAEKFIKQIYT